MNESSPRNIRSDTQTGRFNIDGLYNRCKEHESMTQASVSRKVVLFRAPDIIEDKKDIIVEAEIPGINDDSMEVILDGSVLTIKGKKRQKREDKNQRDYHRERPYGSFRRTVPMPVDVTIVNLETSYKKGVLEVVLKKAKLSEKKSQFFNLV